MASKVEQVEATPSTTSASPMMAFGFGTISTLKWRYSKKDDEEYVGATPAGANYEASREAAAPATHWTS